MIQKRDVVTCIVLSIITCGIYGIFWLINLVNEINAVCDTPNDTSGGMVFLLSILTCGIYNIYWAYKAGEKLDAKTNTTDKKIIYLALYLFGFGIVADALMQDTLNKIV